MKPVFRFPDGQDDRQKSKVVIQEQAGKKAVTRGNGAAKAAVGRFETVKIPDLEFVTERSDISEHIVCLSFPV
jgi:hypothetical protein